MKMAEFAKLNGTSRTTLYRKIDESGIDIETIRDQKGHLTEDGMRVLSGMLDGTFKAKRVKRPIIVTDENNAIDPSVALMAKVTELREENDRLHDELDTANTRIQELNQTVLSQAQKYAESLAEITKKQLQLEEQRLLTDRAAGRGLFGRMHDALFGNKAQK